MPRSCCETLKGGAEFQHIAEPILLMAGFYGVPFIASFGSPSEAGQPSAGFGSTIDGLHPGAAYATAVNEYLAQRMKVIFGL